MHVLVTAASRHGATTEIADAIAKGLRAAGVDVELRAPQDVASVDDYDAVVLGSGVYAGHWLAPARQFAERHREALTTRPVWLFSSGPLGDPPKPDADPVDIARLLEQTLARDHRVFAGRLDSTQLGFGERLITRVVGAAQGDYRPWPEVEAWATSIAAALASPQPATRH
jgi:menaquinone-dependent protoporphyrinogen oxidase